MFKVHRVYQAFQFQSTYLPLPKFWHRHAAHFERFMFSSIPCVDFLKHKSFQVKCGIKILFCALKVFCIKKSAQGSDLHIELSKYLVTGVMPLFN